MPPCRLGQYAGIVIDKANESRTFEEALSGSNKNDMEEITKLEQRLLERFKISCLGNIKEYADVQVERRR